jgi:iron complex outermembrane receptor protein
MNKRAVILSVLMCGSALLPAGHALAQAAEATTGGEMGEIIVTANKRAENVQKVPISIAVLTNNDLTAAGVTAATQLQVATTNLQIGTLNNQPLIYIRGMGSSNLNAGSEGTVGLYLDGIYLPWSPAVDASFLDVERVEVLKGPQGTLYGRNTTAGAINFITRDPSTKRALELQMTLGTWGTQMLQAYGSTGPGAVSASIAGGITRHNAYLRNRGTGPDYNDRDEKNVRGKVKWEISDAWSATLAADFAYRRDFDGQGFLAYDEHAFAADPATGGHITTVDSDPSHTYGEWPSRGGKYRNYGGSLIIKGDLSFADFTSLTGYRDTKVWTSPDADASDLRLTNFDALNLLESWSQEFQLVSKSDSKLEWVAGLYAFHSKGGLGPVGIYGEGTTGVPIGGFGNPNQFDQADLVLRGFGKTKAFAGYAQASYPIVEGFKLTGGLRYSWERRYLTQQQVQVPAFDYLVVVDVPKESKSFDSFDPKVGLEYSWGRNLVYFTFTKGFRSGGYAIASPGSAGPVDPEKVTAFEIGGKHTIIPGVRFNWAVFKYKFKDLQVSRETNDGQGSLFTLQNASDAKIKGAEAELTVDAIDNLSFNLGVGYTDAKFSNFENAAAFVPAPSGFGYVQASVDVSGRPLARAPKWTISSQATYTIPIGDGHLDLSGNIYYTGKYFLDTPSNVFQTEYALINARATYFLPGDHISVAAFVNNLTNKRIIDAMSSNAYALIVQPNAPRIIGATVSLKY